MLFKPFLISWDEVVILVNFLMTAMSSNFVRGGVRGQVERRSQYENGPEICSKVGNWKFQLGPLDEVYISTRRISANEPIIRVLTDIN